ncbi:MAG TPA: winged helix-turn-helix domain-containing protein [Ktedonobacterales bacterium]|jgi:DNA-binding transcriptional ArsR family regulator
MATIAELLRQYVVAMYDPTRGAILMELGQVGELTPTQIARRLGVTANNVYHHMRVLRELGVVDPPRAVPRDTYVEKYYRINPELAAAVNSDPNWVDNTQATMTNADRKALFCGMYLTMAQLLMRAARRYQAMDEDDFARWFYETQDIMASVNTMDHAKLVRRLARLRSMLAEEWREDAEANSTGAANATADMAAGHADRNVVLMAALPLLWDDKASEE